MTELLPTIQSQSIRDGLSDYLKTTFALTDTSVQDALGRFLDDPQHGMFSGPYLRSRMPFRPARKAGAMHSTTTRDSRPMAIRRLPSVG